MLDTLDDIHLGIKNFFTSNIPEALSVQVAYGDERQGEPVFPSLEFSVFQIDINPPTEVYAGFLRTCILNPDNKTATIRALPTPAHIYFQLDVMAEKRSEELAINTKLIPLIGSRSSTSILTTPRARKLHLYPFSMDSTDGFIDGLFQSNWRFYTVAWFENPATQIVNVVWDSVKLLLNGQEVEIPT